MFAKFDDEWGVPGLFMFLLCLPLLKECVYFRIDFDDSSAPQQQQVSLESDTNDDLVMEETKIVPEDFKIVFISSESKSGSELNSSLECDLRDESEENLRDVKGDQTVFIYKS